VSPHSYTVAQRNYLRRHKTTARRTLTAFFNSQFGTALSIEQVTSTCTRLGLKTGRSGCCTPGCVPHNKGTKGLTSGSSTSFKTGRVPPNCQPVGTEILEADGYTKVKVASPNIWKSKHVMVWEKVHGPVPEGSCVIFADGDKQNFEPDNLVAVKRPELFFLNRKALIQPDKDLTKVAVNIAKVAVRIFELTRRQ